MKGLFLSDNETKIDLLYYESIAKTVVELVQTDTEKPISIGIHGDWGAGKSSVLAMVEDGFSNNDKVLCLRFNGWLFQGFEDAKTVLLESIVEGMKEARPLTTEVKEKAKSLFKRIDWLKVAKKTGGLLLTLGTGLPIGAAAEAIADKLFDALKQDPSKLTVDAIKSLVEGGAGMLKDGDDVGNTARQIHEFRKEFEEFIKTIGIERLVILIDDLDRCLPETAIQTLEAAKLFLFLPHVAFIVAADEGMIEYSVKKHFPDMPIGPAGASYARAYLEKLIQVPFRIPALGDVEIHAYIALTIAEVVLGSDSPDFRNLLNMAREKLQKPWEGARLQLSEITAKFPGIASKVQHSLILSDQLANVLARGTLGNPRQVKRFLNSLMLREAIAKGRGMQAMIKRPVLAKIMLAERFHSEFYADLCKAANLAKDGRVKQIGRLENPQSEDDLAGAGRAKKVTLEPAWEKWAGDETLCEWAALLPKLEPEDLRPYVFVTRDKKAIFGMQTGGPLDAVAETLMGPRLQVSSHSEKLKTLVEGDAAQIFDKLRSRILAEDSFEDTTGGDGPGGFPGIVELVSAHPNLQPRFIRFLEELPVGKIRVWAAKHGMKFVGQPEASWRALTEKWANQTENKSLAAGVKAIRISPKKR